MNDDIPRAEPAPAAPDDAHADAAAEHARRGDLPLVRLNDAFLAGWYRNDTDEMFHGFPIGPEDLVIDVGCGDGSPAAFCAERGAEIVLVDIEADKVAEAERRCREKGSDRVTAFVSDSDPLPIPDGLGSRIVCSEVLEHVADPAQVMRELVRVGRPGALYLLTVPDPVQEEMQKHLAPDIYFSPPNHIRIFSRDDFQRLVEEAGLVVERRDYYGFFLAMWWLLFWTANVPLEAPSHPMLDAWARTWGEMLATPDGLKVKRLFDRFMPKSQLIVARKPGG